MPKTKQFEALSLEGPPFFTTVYMDMFEMSDIFYNHIKTVYSLLADNKIVCVEIPNEERLVFLKKVSSQEFHLKSDGPFGPDIEILEAIELVNWLFQYAPFMAMVGTSNAKW